MSDNWIIVIPEAADYMPSPEARRKAVELFRSIAPRSDEIKEEATHEIRFIDCGGNFERIACPDCDTDVDLDWWRKKMDEESDAQFSLKPVSLPCCSAMRSLDQLKYEWPQGFARFSVEAMNPDIPNLTADQLSAFEAVLGCRVRMIFRHI